MRSTNIIIRGSDYNYHVQLRENCNLVASVALHQIGDEVFIASLERP